MADSSVKKIRPSDPELAMVQDNLALSIQQLLDNLNATPAQQAVLAPILQQVRGAGTPYSIKTPALICEGRSDGAYVGSQPTVLMGTPASTRSDGTPIPQQDASLFVYGQTVLTGSAKNFDGVVIAPQVAGNALRITNIGNTATAFVVQDDGTTHIGATSYAPSFVSSAGFCATLDCGTYWNTSYTANTYTATQKLAVNSTGGGLGAMSYTWKAPRAGSVTGWSMTNTGPVTNSNYFQVIKNGALMVQTLAGTGGNGASFWGTYSKGTYAFAAGDTITTNVSHAASGNFQAQLYLTVEMSA